MVAEPTRAAIAGAAVIPAALLAANIIVPAKPAKKTRYSRAYIAGPGIFLAGNATSFNQFHNRDLFGCEWFGSHRTGIVEGTRRRDEAAAVKALRERHLAIFRRHMVDVITIHADLSSEEIGKPALDERVLNVMREVPRHLFVPAAVAAAAYQDMPLPIGFDKTISQPFMAALMTDLLNLESGDEVLEVGSGLGYQTAILAHLAGRVWSVEIIEEFVSVAEARLRLVGIENVKLRVGDGSRGWAEHAPFDKILVAAAAKEVPRALIEQLKPGGRLVMPLGLAEAQRLTLLEKGADGIQRRELMSVRFAELETGA